MKRKLSDFELCEKYRNENPHGEHVTSLALRLFDRTYKTLDIPYSERRMLEAVCRLHDVGYAGEPAAHAGKSARIVAEEGLSGFTPAQTAYVAGAILLHPRKYTRFLTDPLITGLRNRKRLLRLAAYLRVADALDHSHIQDADIVSIRKNNCGFLVRVRSDGYRNNVPWAELKGDLWEEITGEGLVFDVLPRPKGKPVFFGVVNKDDLLTNAARKILYKQFRVIADNRRAAVEGRDPKHLHDIRVASRRFCEALRFFNKPLKGLKSGRTDKLLRKLRRKLGPARDMQVWMGYLNQKDKRDRLRSDPAGAVYLEKQHLENLKSLIEVGQILTGEDYQMLLCSMSKLLRVEIPALISPFEDEPAAPYMARRLLSIYRKVIDRQVVVSKMTSDDFHELRKLCKRGRYYAEFSAPVLGRDVQRIAGCFRVLTSSLGRVHDIDVHFERFSGRETRKLVKLCSEMKADRKEAVKAFSAAWRRLKSREFSKRVLSRLNNISA